MAEEIDEWDKRIQDTGCAKENEAVLICYADKGRDWRACKEEVAKFKACHDRYVKMKEAAEGVKLVR
ncbi:hypothetical protein SAICODRAFT_5917 [Saitoella complicata NRRL Y-17804]|uniref:CHCH domain-containing protein n=1 Tax=Saitoella complicata (strain BCRC 22490 / CBS 7301 / JCM 7358 / NBRC 10748 / NRRL Y-17804) TaxID=698492 RepID=A0A0E9NRY6_SAICN|nr:uncharacterized protein SAICODRAFT_5917 [Saitoella complicata NRRL Y-17804]ODQ54718.1 hypothetical protein SAICODRAFT_5917 [Saitoella complicata NRRL Y-17804]GAO52518.1 hypothetical protein G7K_6592-t1 [Saitoella complicata NRRL Y-17804]